MLFQVTCYSCSTPPSFSTFFFIAWLVQHSWWRRLTFRNPAHELSQHFSSGFSSFPSKFSRFCSFLYGVFLALSYHFHTYLHKPLSPEQRNPTFSSIFQHFLTFFPPHVPRLSSFSSTFPQLRQLRQLQLPGFPATLGLVALERSETSTIAPRHGRTALAGGFVWSFFFVWFSWFCLVFVLEFMRVFF